MNTYLMSLRVPLLALVPQGSNTTHNTFDDLIVTEHAKYRLLFFLRGLSNL